MEELTKQQEELINNLEVYAQLEVEKETKPLQDLIDLVNASVDIRLVNGSVVSDIRLGSFELEALAMRIPAECSRLQARLNQYNTKNLFRDMRLDAKVAVELDAKHWNPFGGVHGGVYASFLEYGGLLGGVLREGGDGGLHLTGFERRQSGHVPGRRDGGGRPYVPARPEHLTVPGNGDGPGRKTHRPRHFQTDDFAKPAVCQPADAGDGVDRLPSKFLVSADSD